MHLVADVLITPWHEEIALSIAERLGENGVKAKTRRGTLTRDFAESIVLVAIALPLAEFIAGLFREAGKEAWQKLRGLSDVGKRTDTGPRVRLLLQDPETGMRVELESNLPDDAYRQLVELEFTGPAGRRGVLRWDSSIDRWEPT